mgnify:CR=1 FL=1
MLIQDTENGHVFEAQILLSDRLPFTGDHSTLDNRAIADQHPIGAITDLQSTIDDLNNKIADLQNQVNQEKIVYSFDELNIPQNASTQEAGETIINANLPNGAMVVGGMRLSDLTSGFNWQNEEVVARVIYSALSGRTPIINFTATSTTSSPYVAFCSYDRGSNVVWRHI